MKGAPLLNWIEQVRAGSLLRAKTWGLKDVAAFDGSIRIRDLGVDDPLSVSLVGGYGVVRHPIDTRPGGRLALHSHCGKSGSYTAVVDGT